MATISELSTELLARYKKKAGEQASAADKAGNFAKGNKRFKGIMKATKKQFANDAKKSRPMQEDTEQLDEISKATAKSYANQRSAEINDAPVMPFKKKPRDAAYTKRTAQGLMGALKRMSGQKPTSESVEQIDELSAKKTQKYLNRAMDDHDHQNMGRRNTTGSDQAEYARKETLRKKGISRAMSRLYPTSEGVEQIDELSSSTLMKYAGKAEKNASDHLSAARVHWERGDKEADDKSYNKANSRFAGAMKAKQKVAQRLAKEEVEQIEEADKKVHPDALHVSHVGGGKYKVHAVGSNFSDGIKVGEHVSDSELDDFSEMGGKIKHMKKTSEEFFGELHAGEVVFEDGTAVQLEQQVAGKFLMVMESLSPTAREQLAEVCMSSHHHLQAAVQLINSGKTK